MSLSHLDQSARRKAAGRRYATAGLTMAAGLLALAPAAHAAHQEPAPAGTVSANDPIEGFNRGAFKIGMGLDKVLLAPIAHGYMAVTPKPVRNHIGSAVYNLGEPNTVINMVLQGKPKRAMRSTTRFVVNSTVGVLGLFDVAAKMHLPRRDSDFGQTFGYYGAGPGAYIYVPLMGPLNVRDGIGRALDMATDPVGAVAGGIGTDFGKARLGVTILDVRASADPGFHALKDSSDPYVTVRSAYGQYREAFIRQATGEAEDLPDFDAPPPDASAPAATSKP